MDLKTGLTLVVTILVAFIGFAAKYLNDLKIAQRKDRLERVNRQLKEFYGPLYALTQAAAIAWQGFRKQWRPYAESYWKTEPLPDKEEATAWRLWMSEVFMPLNLRIERVIVENADLLDDQTLPDSLLTFCAPVAAYKTIIKKWKSGDYTDHVSLVSYPREAMNDYAMKEYNRIKKKQDEILGKV